MIVKFTVQGTHPFPMDMLRYDSAYPATGESAVRIEKSICDYTRADPEPIVIELVGPRNPTEGRWNSFGWQVLSKVVLLVFLVG